MSKSGPGKHGFTQNGA